MAQPFALEGGPLGSPEDLAGIQSLVAGRYKLQDAQSGGVIIGAARPVAQAAVTFIWPLGRRFRPDALGVEWPIVTERTPRHELYLPLTDAELRQFEMQSGVTGLSSVDASRLLAEVRRLQAILRHLPPRDIVVAAKKAGIRLRHPDVPE